MCALDWCLWIPGTYILFVLAGLVGITLGLVLIFALSAWIHRPNQLVGGKVTLGPVLALATPVIALVMSLVVLQI